MYRNLKAEIVRSGLTLCDILEIAEKTGENLNCTPSTLSLKINGKAEFTFSEAVALRNIVNPEVSLDYLYKKD